MLAIEFKSNIGPVLSIFISILFEANTDVDDAENNSVALENGEKRTSPVEGPLSQHFRANNVWTLVCPQLFRIGRAD